MLQHMVVSLVGHTPEQQKEMTEGEMTPRCNTALVNKPHHMLHHLKLHPIATILKRVNMSTSDLYRQLNRLIRLGSHEVAARQLLYSRG